MKVFNIGTIGITESLSVSRIFTLKNISVFLSSLTYEYFY